MNTIWWFIDDSTTTRLTLALFHFLWQGCCAGLVVFVAGGLLRNQSARVRYALNATTMLLMFACLPITFLCVEGPHSTTTVASTNSIPWPTDARSSGERGTATHAKESSTTNSIDQRSVNPLTKSASSSAAIREPYYASRVPWLSSMLRDLAGALTAWSKWIVAFYVGGVILAFARLLRAIWGGHRLRRIATLITDSDLLESVRKLAKHIKLHAVPAVAYCERISVPVVVGVLRPMVLLPMELVTGLPSDQLEALLLHELSHIRRLDPFVNLFQRFVEAVLFFHPVVWFVSRRVSLEREMVADDMVLLAGWDRSHYADALVRAAELATALSSRGTASQSMSLASSGGNPSEFKVRVLRLLDSQPPKLDLSPVSVLLSLIFVGAMTMFAWSQTGKETPKAGSPDSPAVASEKNFPADLARGDGESQATNEAIGNSSAEMNPIVKIKLKLTDAANGAPITAGVFRTGAAMPERSQDFYGGFRSERKSNTDGWYEFAFEPTDELRSFRVIVFAAGYEKSIHTMSLGDRPPQEFIDSIRLLPGRTTEGRVLDHSGNPAANARVYFIPTDYQPFVDEMLGDRDPHKPSKDPAIAQTMTDSDGKFSFMTGPSGMLAVSTATCDLQPFPPPAGTGPASLKLNAPAYLSLNIDEWRFAFADRPDSGSQIKLHVHRLDREDLWGKLDEYTRSITVDTEDPDGMRAQGGWVGGTSRTELIPIETVGVHRRMQAMVHLALPPGRYTVQRFTDAGSFDLADGQPIKIRAGSETSLDWATPLGNAIRGTVVMPLNALFAQSDESAPIPLDWTVPQWASVHIRSRDGRDRAKAAIDGKGNFVIPNHLPPGEYIASTWISLPPDGWTRHIGSMVPEPELFCELEFAIQQPPADPASMLPLDLSLQLKAWGTRIRTKPTDR